MGSPITVQFLDDRSLVTAGYRRTLSRESRIRIVGDPPEDERTWSKEADIIVLDVSAPGPDAIDLVRRVAARRSGARILIISQRRDSLFASRALGAGAHGYLSEATRSRSLIEAIRSVASGERYISPDVQIPNQQGTTAEATHLSVRELQILKLLTHGLDLAQVAEHLGVSTKTIANCQSLIKQKLGAGSALQLVLIAQRMGLG